MSGLIGAALWIWMAQMNKRGRNWARITSTVFFGIETLGLLLWQGQSSGYFKAKGALRY